MTSVANLHPDPAPIVACTISRDVQNFDLLIDDMEIELRISGREEQFLISLDSRISAVSKDTIVKIKKSRLVAGFSILRLSEI